jgi:rubrerythrin
MATIDDLKEAFAGESQANRKYLAFAKKAEQDGFPQVARLFRAAAEAETVHAHSHFRVLGGVKDTVSNLEAALDGEGFEFMQMYPRFVKQAEREAAKPAVVSFRHAMAVEEVHHDLYKKALKAVQAGRDLPQEKISICPVCGYTVTGNAPGRCPVCSTEGKKFLEVK